MRLLILFLLITSSVFSQMNDVSELTFENLENDSSELYIDFSDSLYIVKLDKYYTCGNIIDIIIYIKKMVKVLVIIHLLIYMKIN